MELHPSSHCLRPLATPHPRYKDAACPIQELQDALSRQALYQDLGARRLKTDPERGNWLSGEDRQTDHDRYSEEYLRGGTQNRRG